MEAEVLNWPVGSNPAAKEFMDKVLEETAKKRAEMIETYVVAFLQMTGLTIEQVEMVEEMRGNSTIWYLRKRL